MGMMVYSLISAFRRKSQEDLCELENILVYIVSFRKSGLWRDPVSNK